MTPIYPAMSSNLLEKHPLLQTPTLNGQGDNYVLVIHGGAGTMSKEGSTPEQQARYKTTLRNALQAGYQVLRDGGEAMDAVVAAVTILEGISDRRVSVVVFV